MDTRRPPITGMMHVHLAKQLDRRTGLRRQTIEIAAAHLERFLETDGPKILAPDEQVVLEMEDQFGAEHPLLSTMSAEPLIFVLAGFLHHPWLLPDRIDRTTQDRYTEASADLIVRNNLVDNRTCTPPLIDRKVSARSVRQDLRRARPTPDVAHTAR